MNNLNHIKEELKEVIISLQNENHIELSKSLQHHSKNLEKSETILSTLTELSGLCHVKGLGDLYMNNYQGYSWPNKISNFKVKCEKEIKRLTIRCT